MFLSDGGITLVKMGFDWSLILGMLSETGL